ncbi:putative Nitroreductase family protein [Verrucomicrobia bacterium]|nr:putative Nitroreductase family protein [Verrucomicrobiota bacterium]
MNDYEQFLLLARSRRSVRKFSEQPVGRENLLRVLEAARWAPSNHNRQPWKFIVLENRSQIVGLAEAIRTELSQKLKSLPPVVSGYTSEFADYATFFSGAPVVIVVLHRRPVSFSAALLRDAAHPDLVSGEPLSAGMAVQNLLLAAHAVGLGSCVMTAPLIVGGLIVRELEPPPGYELTCLVALGYADERPPGPRRKSIEQIAEFREDTNRS